MEQKLIFSSMRAIGPISALGHVKMLISINFVQYLTLKFARKLSVPTLPLEYCRKIKVNIIICSSDACLHIFLTMLYLSDFVTCRFYNLYGGQYLSFRKCRKLKFRAYLYLPLISKIIYIVMLE